MSVVFIENDDTGATGRDCDVTDGRDAKAVAIIMKCVNGAAVISLQISPVMESG